MAKIKSSVRINNTGFIIEPPPVDPTIYDDPVALQTDWRPLNYDSASFCTYRLRRVNSDRLAFKPTPQTLVLFGVFPFAGIVLLLYTFSGHLEAFPLLLGFCFLLLGFYLLYYQAAPIVFDRKSGLFTKGRKSTDRAPDMDNPKNNIDFDNVHALQLISKIIYRKVPYLCYDLNLVLKNGKRIAVLSHSNKNKIRDDTLILADFLDKPLWEAID